MHRSWVLIHHKHCCWRTTWTAIQMSPVLRAYMLFRTHIFSSPGPKVDLGKDIPMIIPLQFGFSQFISFREEDLWNFSQSEHIIGPGSPNCPGMIIGRSSTKFLFFMPIGNPRWLSPQVIVLTQDHMGKIQKYVLLWSYCTDWTGIKGVDTAVFVPCCKNLCMYFVDFRNDIKKPEALKSLYRSPGYKKKQLVLCKNYVLQW
jgi:hypothetical protein